MTRNRFFRFLSTPRLSHTRRRRAVAALVAAAVVSNSFGLATGPIAFAQSGDVSSEIKQVVGKELNGRRRTSGSRSGGLLSGLFGGSSSSSRSSTKDGEPYRKATPVPSERDVDWQGVPYHGSGSSQTASRNPAPIEDPSGRTQRGSIATSRSSAVPTPPPIAKSVPQSVPRRIESSAPPQVVADVNSSRPEPLSVSRSSRRPAAAASDSFTPTKLEPKVNTNVVRSDKPVELVPRVSRKVIKTEPAKQTVAKSDSETSRRVQPEPVAAPKKIEVQPEAPKVVKKPAAPAPTMQAAVPQRKPAPKAIVPQQPAPVADTQMSKLTLGEARQATLGSVASKPVATPQAPSAAEGKMAFPEQDGFVTTSSRVPTQPKVTLGNVVEAKRGQMTTFGTDSGTSRSGGSLANSNPSNRIALQPISDRLPAADPDESVDAMKAWHDSQNVSHDGFAARSNPTQGRPVNGPTSPNYSAAAYGYGQATPAPPAYQSTSNHANTTIHANTGAMHPNAMRESMTTQAAPAVHPSVQANTNSTSTELPGIRVMTAGPRNIMMRQTHPYEVIVENRGSVVAEGLVVRAHVPDWADVVGQQVTRGDVQGNTDETIRNLHWKLDRLEPGQTEKMFVRLKAARPGTHDLDVDWTMQPQTRRMQVTVQEPELALTIDGPDEVIYGHSKTYQIRVLNPGDGVAPDVVFTLSPKSSSPQSQRIGDIPAGKEAQFEVELTAQDLGELKIHGLAVGDLQLRAEADKTVRVLAADLEAVLTGPELKYQDAEAVYQLQLTNHGTTASENVIANLNLPMGVTYQGGMEGATVIDKQLRWKIASLTPGAVRQYQFQCRMDATGTQAFKFDCKGSAAGQTDVALETNVEAIADLVLSIEDPQAPAPIGQDVVYQIVIRNRGSKPAIDVRAVAQFSHGIEPTQISGHAGKVITGQVLIEPISRIDAGEEVRMKIVARADTSGHHRFRTEVRSGDTVLVAEEATNYLEPRNERITRRSGPGGNEFSLPMR